MAELPYEEIAKILEKEEPTIRKMISRARKKLNYFLKDECILYNPQAKCKCRMNKLVREIDLPGAYERLRKTVLHINVYRESEKILPGKNYWDKLLN
jgi:RNA polymerase sigma-70 factor (ECF subfamily)